MTVSSAVSQPTLKQRLAAREVLIATWLKTPSPVVAEVLAGTDLDFICVDAEHAPFDRSAIDGCVFACRALGKPVLVRPATGAPHDLLQALDVGAEGVVVPHVRSAAEAVAVVGASHYGPGGRGYAGSTRAADYTRRVMGAHLSASTERTVVVAQIEDAEALDAIDAIAGTDRLDALFIGRADLAVSLGASSASAAPVIAAAERISAAGHKAGKPVGTFLSDLDEIPFWRERGVTFFLLESDHVFLLSGAASLVARCRVRLG